MPPYDLLRVSSAEWYYNEQSVGSAISQFLSTPQLLHSTLGHLLLLQASVEQRLRVCKV